MSLRPPPLNTPSLRHNVIKAGLRLISLSYQRISLADVAAKLQLDSAEDAQYIVAKVYCPTCIEPSDVCRPSTTV
jgi:26S proteasome regulatory subunit N3